MSIKKAFSNVLFQPEEPDPPPAAERVVTLPRAVGTAATFRTIERGPAMQTSSSTVADPEMARDIEAALAKVPAPGYTELLTQLEILAPAIPDEGARVSAAVASVAAMLRVPAAQIRQSVEARLQELEQQRAVFHSSLQSEVNETSTKHQQSLRDATGRIAELEAELSRLRMHADDLQRGINALATQSTEVAARFDATYKTYYNDLTGLLSRIR